MDEQDRATRLADAIDAIVLGDAAVPSDPELAPLLSLAEELRDAMPLVQAAPAFQESLRTRLITRRQPWWKRLFPQRASKEQEARREADPGVARGPVPRPYPGGLSPAARPTGYGGEGHPPIPNTQHPTPRYAFAFAALALVIGAAVVLTRQPQPGSQPIHSQPANPAPAATAAAFAAPVAPPRALDAAATTQRASSTSAPLILPPLSEAMPVAVFGGLGGGGLGSADWAVPERKIRFELAASLPDLPSVATVYRYEVPSPDLEKLRAIAARLGLDPAGLRPMADSPDTYVLSDPVHGSLDNAGPGASINYRVASSMGKLAPEARALPEGDAVRIATNWLAGNALLPAAASSPTVSRPYPGAAFEEVVFRPAEPANIVGDYPAVRVGIDSTGEVISAALFWPKVASSLTVPARTAEAAWQMLVSGKGQLQFEGDHGRPDFQGKVTVVAAETAYTMTYGLDGQPYLQPVVLFRGQSTMDGDSEARPFTAQVPMAADSALAKEEVRYLFTGQLPSAPAEAAVLERAASEPLAPEQVRDLGRKLGLSGEPRVIPGPPGTGPNWEMGDPNGAHILRVSGNTGAASWMESWTYSPTSFEPASDRETASPPDEATAVRIATDFLRSRGLLGPDLSPGRVQPAALGASVSTVLFPRLVDGLPVVEPAGLAVVLDARGEVVSLTSNQHSLQPVRTGPLLAPSEALAAVQAGKGSIQVPSLPGRTIYSDHAEIRKVELVYRLRAPEAGRRPPLPGQTPAMRYEPFYLFTGTIEVGESRKPLPFTTALPALKP